MPRWLSKVREFISATVRGSAAFASAHLGTVQAIALVLLVADAFAALVAWRLLTWDFVVPLRRYVFSVRLALPPVLAYGLLLLKELRPRFPGAGALLAPWTWLKDVFFQRVGLMVPFIVVSVVVCATGAYATQRMAPPRWLELEDLFFHGENDRFRTFRARVDTFVRPQNRAMADALDIAAEIYAEHAARLHDQPRLDQTGYQEIGERLRAALEDDGDPDPIVRLASAQLAGLERQYDDALSILVALDRSRDPRVTPLIRANARFTRALVLLDRGDLDAAATALAMLAETPAKYVNLSLCDLERGRFDWTDRDAGRGLDLLALTPNRTRWGAWRTSLQTNRCVARTVLGHAGAEADCEAAFEADRGSADTRAALALFRITRGEFDSASAVVAGSGAPDSRCLDVLRSWIADANQQPTAVDAYRRALGMPAGAATTSPLGGSTTTPDASFRRLVCTRLDAICGPGTRLIPAMHAHFCN
jgi:hypothetical protein